MSAEIGNQYASKQEYIEANADKIKEWVSEGKTMKSIADALQISTATLYKYFSKDDLKELKKNRKPAVIHLEDTMYMAATGYTKKIKKLVKVKETLYENGRKLEEYEDFKEVEEEVYFPPDITAAIFLLKNWGKYMNEPAAMKIRQKEVELREKQIEAQTW